MTTIERNVVVATGPAPQGSYVEWSPVIAGAIGASAISFLLLTFGGAVGLTLTSPWPNEGVPAWAILFAVAWWSVMVQIGSFFAGGYLAGRMRNRWADATLHEVRFRDGTHGFTVWAVGVLFGALLIAYAGGAALHSATQATATVAAGAASGNVDAAKNSAASTVTGMLLRPTPRASAQPPAPPPPAPPAAAGDQPAPPPAAAAAPPPPPKPFDPAYRDEVNRILESTVANRELTADNRNYLVGVVAARDGISEDEARKRVDAGITQLQTMENDARNAAEKARKAGLIAGFLTAASLLISLAAAIGGAHLGGRHRDEGTMPHLFGRRFW
ncbi:MAG: hypothetical protein AB7T86_17815 [Xanthobacteraceae bacterium]|uniref:hypothetical protein n=1 Tax=Pseudolabrys sp. TaxID=1960880 RepID=UPI003D106FE9